MEGRDAEKGEQSCGREGIPGAPFSPYPMLDVEEAMTLVLACAKPLPKKILRLKEAGKEIRLAEDVIAEECHPDFDASLKDGYAVLSDDGVGVFEVVAEVRCGDAGETRDSKGMIGRALNRGEVAYVTTGAPMPPGADAVVEVESTVPVEDGRVRIARGVKKGTDIRRRGSDVMKGDIVLKRGDSLGPAEVALLASLGVSSVHAHAKPVVAIMSSGDELVEANTVPLPRGKVRDTNRGMLRSLVNDAGAEVVDLGIARDEAGTLDAMLDAAIAAEADVLITSGGVSMGDRDLIKPMFERRGKVHFGRLNMKPGKPFTFATVEVPAGSSPNPRRMLCFGLPGNPVSSWATFYLIVLPAVRKMAGWLEPELRRVQVTLEHDAKTDPIRPEYQRVILRWIPSSPGAPLGGFLASGTGGQSSSRILSARSANALVELPAGKGIIVAGSVVSALLVGDLGAMPV